MLTASVRWIRGGLPLVAAVAVVATVIGCGGGTDNLTTVSGTVTLDGEPLPNAIVTFQPTGETQGRPAYGYTDDNGHYELQFTEEESGAIVGTHRVTISTHQEPMTKEEGAAKDVPGVPERVPAQYNTHSELVEEVKEGGNTIDFDLSSEGEIIEPPSEEDVIC